MPAAPPRAKGGVSISSGAGRNMKIQSRSQAQTRKLGERLGRCLKGLDLVCLSGGLGSGKTTFTQGLAKGLGCRGGVQSPTFILARVHRGSRLTLYHLDLYRVAPGETGDIGIEEYLSDPQAVCAVEWPVSGGSYFPRDYFEVRFTHGRVPSRRGLRFLARGPRSREILGSLRRLCRRRAR